MADDADLAAPFIENTVAAGIAQAQAYKSLVACGRCHYCSSAVGPGQVFCDRDCGDDWQHEQDRRRAQGL
jgi:hypothetical protein